MNTENAVAESIAALHEGNAERIAALVAGDLPSGGGIALACALADADEVDRILAEDPAAATAPSGPDAYAPLFYLAYSRVHHVLPDRVEAMVRIARTLIAHGADVNASYFHPDYPTAPLCPLYPATGPGDNAALARVFLEAGANPNDGESIYHAAEANNRDCLEALLEHGADISARHSHWGNTPIYFLLGYREVDPPCARATEGVRWLLEHGADPNVTSYAVQETPLHLAVRNGRGRATLEMLIDHGADVDAQRFDGRTPFQLAVRSGNTTAMELLSERGAVGEVRKADLFVGAAMRADEDVVRSMLLDDPGMVRLFEPGDHAMLSEAASDGNIDALRLMLGVGFDVAARGQMGGTALHHAAWRGRRAMVELLLDHDAPIDVRCEAFQGTPLDWSVHGSTNCGFGSEGDYVAIVRAIIAAGADPATTNPGMGSAAVAAELARASGATPSAGDAA